MARHVLMIAIVLDAELGPRECTEMFLEIYGNSMLRKQTSAYLTVNLIGKYCQL